MNKAIVAQQAKTSTFLPPAQGNLQRKCDCGNHTVAGGECEDCVKNKSGLQRKFAIGASHDPLEREADRIADQVLAAPAHPGVSGTPPRIQRFSGQSNGQMDAAPASVDQALASPGRPLEPALRQDMEQRFGHDFSRVRVHLDSRAAASAREVGSLAYTVGRDVVFAQGQFGPHSAEGRRLLAHELAHTVQQEDAGHLTTTATSDLQVGYRNDPAEREAESVAQSALAPRSDRGEKPAATSVQSTGQTALRRDGGEESKGSDAPAPARDEGGEKAPASAPAGTGGGASCDPKGILRADYLKEPGTTTGDFGLTTLSGTVTVPTVHVSKSAKGLVLDPTDTKLPLLTSVYTSADAFIEGEIISIGESTDCPSGKKYPLKWRILPSGAQKIREAEIEHCDDFQHAFAVSLQRYADVVNDLAARKKVFASQKAAEKYVTGVVGPKPDTWADVFTCLAKKTKLRDTNNWHTPRPLTRPPRLDDHCQFAMAYVSSLPEVGRHPTPVVIKDCGEGPPATAKGGGKRAEPHTRSAPVPQAEGKVEKLVSKASPDFPGGCPESGRVDIVAGTRKNPGVGHDFARVQILSDRPVRPDSSAQSISTNGVPSTTALRGPDEIIINVPDTKQNPKSPSPAPAPKAPAPKQTPPAKAADCPTDITVAHVLPMDDRDFGKDGFLTGWGGIAKMEVSDPDGKTWDGTEMHERLKRIKNTCGARAKDVCSNRSGEGGSNGSTFKVGSATRALDKVSLPAAKNSFYDLHLFALRTASILHELNKSECEIQCQQSYECGGKQIGPDFTITYTTKKDTVAQTYDVTRVAVKKEAVTKTAAPPATPSGGGKP